MRLPRLLDPVEARVLGVLLEKAQATPEYYPLTVSALVAGCNQKSNREPVLELTESEVLSSLESLRTLVLVWKVTGSRTDKWEENLTAKLELDAPTRAVLTLLFLRGPQTAGELRSRSDRLQPFATLGDVETLLSALGAARDPLVAEIPRRPGQKESRWGHLLSGDLPAFDEPATTNLEPQGTTLASRVSALEQQVESLRASFEELKKSLGAP